MSLHDWSTTAASNTTIDGIDIAENCAAANINNAIRSAMANVKGGLIAVATSGTDTYTATLAPAPAAYTSGMVVFLRFGNANTSTTPTINLNSLGAKTIVTAANVALVAGDLNGDHFLVYDGTNFRLGNYSSGVRGPSSATSGNAVTFSGTTGKVIQDAGAKPRLAGLETIWVPAVAMYAATTNGAGTTTTESTTNKVMTKALAFDTATQEFAHFAIAFPKSWNEGTVTFQPYWTARSGTGNVVWALQGVAFSDGDAIDTAFGTEQTSTQSLSTTSDLHIGPVSSAITIGGTPAAGDQTFFRIKRNVSNDNLNADAELLGVRLFFTTDASDDT